MKINGVIVENYFCLLLEAMCIFEVMECTEA